MAQKLIDKGYAKVYALKGGWDLWMLSKYPVERIIRESVEKTDKGKKTAQKQKNDQKSSEKTE